MSVSGTVIADAVAAVVEEQSWFRRYKGTVLIVLQALAWVLGVVGSVQLDAPEWVGVSVGVAATVIAALVNRFTRDGATPSLAATVSAKVEEQQAPPAAKFSAYVGV